MILGVPKEVKDHESRVGMTPGGVKALVEAGHTVLVEQRAGVLSAMPDDEYESAGAEMVASADEVWKRAEMVVKVKEPVESEYRHFREGLVLFTYLHLAPLTELTDALLKKKVTGIAYETVRDRAGSAAAADADERGCRTPERAGRRGVSDEGAWRPWFAAGRSSGGASGECVHYRRRRCWNECGEDGAGTWARR